MGSWIGRLAVGVLDEEGKREEVLEVERRVSRFRAQRGGSMSFDVCDGAR